VKVKTSQGIMYTLLLLIATFACVLNNGWVMPELQYIININVGLKLQNVLIHVAFENYCLQVWFFISRNNKCKIEINVNLPSINIVRQKDVYRKVY